MAKPQLPSFGIQWPEGTPLMRRHTYCAYHGRGNGSFYHRREIIRSLWPEETFTWHEWSDRRLKSTNDYDLVTWIGAGATGKTTDAAAQVLEWWLEAPMESAGIVCSTTIKMLKLRIWSEVTRLFCALPKAVEFRDENGAVIETFKLGYLGELIDSDMMIRWKAGDNKHAIFGLGVNEGSVAEAMSNLVGIHARRMWLVLDELQGIREAIDVAKDNMSKNAKFKCLGMGNTDENMQSLLRRAATPINGWDSVDTSTALSWETEGGVVAEKGIALRFDGRESPAIFNPKKYPFLINQQQIDGHIRKVKGNLNDPGLCSQVFAVWPSIGITSTVLDEQLIVKFKCREPATWTNGYSRGAAFDPAFEGGDTRILQLFKYAMVNDDEGERWLIEFGEWFHVPVDKDSNEPLHYQLVQFCKGVCEAHGITSDEFASDSTGEGGGLKAIFDTEWGKIMGIEFGGSPSDSPMPGYKTTGGNRVRQTAKDVYDRRVTELCYNLREFALGNGIRGLCKEAAEQACARKTIYKNRKNSVEKKSDLKARGIESPGHLDACAIACAYVKAQGATPGGEVIASKRANSILSQLAREGAEMCSEVNYLLEV